LEILVVLNRQLRKKFTHASSWSTNFSLCCVFHVLIRVCLNENETFKGYERYYHYFMSISPHRPWTFTFNLFPKTTGPIVFKLGRSVHLIVLQKNFSSPGLRAQMSFFHHFVSVVCHPLTFRIWSSQELLGQIGPNSDVILFECSSSKIVSTDFA
jgi:hypothetical protein